LAKVRRGSCAARVKGLLDEPAIVTVTGDTDLLHLLVERVEEYAMYVLDPDGRVASWNAGAERIKGYAADEIIGCPYDTFFTDEDRAAGKPKHLLERARAEGSVEDEGWRLRKGGARFWADAILTALFDGDRLLGYAKITRDLTARRDAEAKHELFMQAPAIIAVLSGPEHRFELVNPLYLQMTGRRDASQLLGKTVRDARPEVVEQGYLEALDRVYRTGEPFVANESLITLDRRGDGSLEDVYLNFVYQPIRDPAGKVNGILLHAVDVTEQVRARQRVEALAAALAEERQRFAAIFDQSTAGIARADLEGRFELVNDRYCEIVGRSRAELLGGLRMQDMTHPDDLPRNDQLFQHLVRDGAAYAIEKRYVRPDGSTVWVRNTVSPIGDADGVSRYALAVTEDISDRKRAEAAAEADLRDTRLLRDLGARFAAETDAATLHEEILAAALAITHADGGTVQLLDERTSLLTLLATSGFDRSMDGYRSVQSTPLTSRSGRPLGTLSTHWRAHHRPTERELRFLDLLARQAADLIDSKRAEAALLESEQRLRALVTASSNVVYRMSPDWSEMWHLQGREFIHDTAGPSRTWVDKYIPPDDRARVMAAIHEAIRSKTAFELEHQVWQVDGSVGWTVSRAVPLLSSDGEVVEWFGMATDVTRRKQAEDALRESEERFRMLAANISQFAWMADPQGWIFWYNRRWFDYTSTTLDEMQGWGWTKVHHPDHVDRVVARIQRAWDTGALGRHVPATRQGWPVSLVPVPRAADQGRQGRHHPLVWHQHRYHRATGRPAGA
jgi:PAS domain S-box-containing protein